MRKRYSGAIVFLIGIVWLAVDCDRREVTPSVTTPAEIGLCDDVGVRRTPVSANIAPAPALGVLKPPSGLMPSGSVSVTLSITTTAPADCRWSGDPDIPYDGMSQDFQQGQGTIDHSTVVSGLSDLVERWFYVRCRDRSGERDPDDFERQTHLRVLGAWEGGYPRIANLWANYDPELGAEFFAGYDLFIPYSWSDSTNQAAAIRAANPEAKILLTQKATKGRPESDPLTAEWWNSSPGDPGYICLLRNSSGDILLVERWGHPMYNMTQPYCRTVLAKHSVEAFLSASPDQGDNLAYDGIYWDLLHGHISWLSEDVDSDLDGQPDDPSTLDAAYQAGLEDFLSQVRACLPNAILMGNEAPQSLAPWINGRLYEWQLPTILDGADWLNWNAVAADYRDWTGRGRTPRTTFIQSAPESLYSEKYPVRSLDRLSPAVLAEAAASYRRMRYGLISALMGDGLFSYDYGPDKHGDLWWYDEFGAPGGAQATTLPPRGYLGQPTGDPMLLVKTLDAPNQVINGDFEDGLNGWSWWVNGGAGASAGFEIDYVTGVSDTAAAKIAVTSAAELWSVEFRQFDVATVADHSYTLSFWARSDVPRTVQANVIKQNSPWTDYGFYVEAFVTPQWQRFQLWDDASVTADDGKLQFLVGDVVGELWLDDVQFQAGALGVWARSFENGLAVINTTEEAQTAALPDVYCRLNGSQAPLFQVRVDDDEAEVSGGWSDQAANDDQFGATVQVAPANSAVTVIYTPTLAYSGTYRVLAWVAPTATQSSAVSVKIHHAQGKTVALLDETTGEVGWRDLGTYTFDAGDGGGAVLAATGHGIVVADALKWESTARYNDGTPVSQIKLQPQDGMVLRSCHVVDEPAYLPLVLRRGISGTQGSSFADRRLAHPTFRVWNVLLSLLLIGLLHRAEGDIG